MKIYYEFIFIVNFLLDFMILYGTKRILKINKNNYRLILGGLIGALITFILFFKVNSLELFIIKVIFSFLIIIVSFGFKNIIKNIIYFYLISIIIGGTFYLLDLNNNGYFYYFILVIGSFFIIYIIMRELLNYKEKYVNKYIVNIYIKNKHYSLEGFIDTGNRLISPIKGEPIILVNLKINSKRIIYVPYKALNYSGIISCIKPDRVVINNREFNNCLIGLATDKFNLDGIDCILPNKFKEKLS